MFLSKRFKFFFFKFIFIIMSFNRLTEIFEERFDKDLLLDLYRLLPNKETSPNQWDKQIKFWSSIIKQWSTEINILECKIQDILDSLIYNTLYPPIYSTIEFLINLKIIILKKNFLKKKSFIKSIYNLIKPIDLNPDSIIIFSQNVSLYCQRIQRQIISDSAFSSDLVISDYELENNYEINNLDLIIIELEKSGLAERINNNGFYFKSKNYPILSSTVLTSILNTKNLIRQIDLFINNTNQYIENEINRAKQYERKGRHSDALNSISRKRYYEEKIEKSFNIKQKLEILLSNLRENEMNSFMLKEFNNVNKIIKNSLKIEDVDEVMDQLEESISNSNEINQTLSNNKSFNNDYENELRVLTGILTPKKIFPDQRKVFEYKKIIPQKKVAFNLIGSPA